MLPRLNYWTRALPPKTVAPAAKSFDDLVLGTALRKLGLRSPLPDEAQTLLKLPVRLGGLGLRSMEAVSPVAWWSALAQICPRIRDLHNGDEKLLINSVQGRIQAQCWNYFKAHHAKCDGKLIPQAPNQFWNLYRKGGHAGLQRDVLKLLEEARASALVRETKSQQMKARLVGCRAPQAGAWLTTPLTATS